MTDIEKIACEIIKNKALRLLGRREYSVWGLIKKLREKFPENFAGILEVINEFKEKEWVSDERFCEIYVREKANYSGWGERKIIVKLQEHKIGKTLIQRNLDKYFSENVQIEKAKELAIEKNHRLDLGRKKLTDYEKQKKIKLFLVSRGFSFGIAQITVDMIKNEY
jgi:regulatory protein